MDLSSASIAASTLTQNVAALQNAIGAVGQNPTAGGVAAQAQAGLLPQIGTSVLKTALASEATTAAQLTQMISQGSGVNILA